MHHLDESGVTSLATRKASSGLRTRPSLPGTVGTPAACTRHVLCSFLQKALCRNSMKPYRVNMSHAEQQQKLSVCLQLASDKVCVSNMLRQYSCIHNSMCMAASACAYTKLLECKDHLEHTFMVSRAVDLSPIVRIWLG